MRKLTALTLTAAFCSGAAFATEDFDFDTHDTDGDGQLNATEVSGATEVSANFDAWDTNGDGLLDEGEVDAGFGADAQTETISDEGLGEDPPVTETATDDASNPDPMTEESLDTEPAPVDYEPVPVDEPVGEPVDETGAQDEPLFRDRAGQDDGATDDAYQPASDEGVEGGDFGNEPLDTTEEPVDTNDEVDE